MSEEPESAGPGGLLEIPLFVLDEVIRAVPVLIDRTRAQAELARSLASHVPCIGGVLRSRAAVQIPAHEAVQPVSVLQVVACEDESDGVDDGLEAPPEPAAEPSGAHPSEDSLAVPDYDSLAASQVVPRLAVLTDDELAAVHAYERAHRNRQTILNRVTQLRTR